MAMGFLGQNVVNLALLLQYIRFLSNRCTRKNLLGTRCMACFIKTTHNLGKFLSSATSVKIVKPKVGLYQGGMTN